VSPRASHLIRNGISLLLAVVLLWLFLRSVDLKAVGRAIAHAHAGWLGLALFVNVACIPFRSWRWTLLLSRAGRVPQKDALSATAIGFAMSTLLPARAGEIVRPVVLTRRTSVPLSMSMASVGLERLIDLVVVLVLFISFALSSAAPAQLPAEELARLALLRRSALALGAVSLVLLPLFALLAVRPAAARRVTAPFLKLVPARHRERAAAAIAAFLEGLGAVRTPREVLLVGLSSLVLWLTICLQIYATMRAFDVTFAFPVTFFVLTWCVLGLAIPTPGGLGGYHAAAAYALTGFFAVPDTTAKAFAIVSHLVSFAPVTLIGLAFLSAGGLKMRTLAADSEDAT
jgi:uncharacterized protein (TIRG00374 family)